jgi:hypothetical protein
VHLKGINPFSRFRVSTFLANIERLKRFGLITSECKCRSLQKAQVMELRKSVATLEFVKSVKNSIFVDKSLPYLLNFAFIKFFPCSFDSLHSCSNLHQICFFFKSNLGASKFSFRLLIFFWVKKLEGSCNICQVFPCVFYLLDISSSFTMNLL